MTLLHLLTQHDALLMEEERLIANAFCYNPEQLEAKLRKNQDQVKEILDQLNKKLSSCPTRRQYDNLMGTIESWMLNY